ncbi:MAG: hypothetical protein JXQ96_06840 [Cyclobacteriaceae bacterium]
MNRPLHSLIATVFVLLSLQTNSWSQDVQTDTVGLLKVTRVNFSANNYSIQPNLPAFDQFQNDFRFGNRLLTSTMDEFSQDDLTANSNYSGFMVNFIFESSLLKEKTEHRRQFFTAAFESGNTNIEMYRIVATDTSRLAYRFSSDIFRITFGYRRTLTKKDNRLKFYSGLELVNEFNISGAIFEDQYDAEYSTLEGERKLFAKKRYNIYLNVPIGLDWRLFKRASMFLHINFALGSQNADPFRLNGLNSGSRFGVSLKV